MSDSERRFLDEIREEFSRRLSDYDQRHQKARQLWMTIAGLLLAGAITLGAANITLVANHGVRIDTLEDRYKDITPYTHFIDYVDFMNLKFRAFESLYQGTFPEQYKSFSDELHRMEQTMIQRQRTQTRGETKKTE